MKRRGFSFIGYCIFFLTIAVTVTAAVMVYSAITEMDSLVIAGIMLGVIVALAALCTLVDYVRRVFVEKRVSDEIAAMTSLMTKGDFSVRLTPRHQYSRFDEYDIIMINLNTLAEELSKTEIMRSDFISNVSHEIKTPLSVISNYAAALKKGGLDDATRGKYLDTLIHASASLSDLVQNILKLNKLENSAIAAEICNIKLDEMLRECILNFEEAIDKKNIEIYCEMDEVSINSDVGLLETVWNNLISNAVKFTPEGGKISVGLNSADGIAVVTVADTGCGIAPETGEHIFDKFYQGDKSHSSEGNGLGLAMVKRVIDILGGEISVSSELGKGSMFTVKLKDLK